MTPTPKLPPDAKAIPGFKNLYATPAGAIFHKRRAEVYAKSLIESEGHLVVAVTTAKGERTHNVSNLICRTFHGPRPSADHLAVHVNGNRLDSRAANVRWMTHKQKINHSVALGRHVIGERCLFAKLTESEVLRIRALSAAGYSYDTLASMFGCAPSNVRFIVKGKTWKHLLPKPALSDMEALRRDVVGRAA